MNLGVFAIICYMHACRNPNEAKCCKYLARTIWLLAYDDEKVNIFVANGSSTTVALIMSSYICNQLRLSFVKKVS